jgi:hypothetical protein
MAYFSGYGGYGGYPYGSVAAPIASYGGYGSYGGYPYDAPAVTSAVTAPAVTGTVAAPIATTMPYSTAAYASPVTYPSMPAYGAGSVMVPIKVKRNARNFFRKSYTVRAPSYYFHH